MAAVLAMACRLATQVFFAVRAAYRRIVAVSPGRPSALSPSSAAFAASPLAIADEPLIRRAMPLTSAGEPAISASSPVVGIFSF